MVSSKNKTHLLDAFKVRPWVRFFFRRLNVIDPVTVKNLTSVLEIMNSIFIW